MYDSITTLRSSVLGDTTLRVQSVPGSKKVALEVCVGVMNVGRFEIDPARAIAVAGHLEFAAHDADPDAALKAWAKGPVKPGT